MKVLRRGKLGYMKIKNATLLFTFLLIVWGFYRILFQLPDIVEELIIKPIIWILPVIYLVKNREKDTFESIGLTFKNLFPSIYLSLILGSFFSIEAAIGNYIKYGGKFNFGANLGANGIFLSLLISFATAISEEIVFRGYIFTRLWKSLNNEFQANFITSIGWTLIHVPIVIFINKLNPASAAIYLVLTFIFGVGSAFLYGRTKNLSSSIFLHVLWEWPIMLFR
ncbi:hypothetical protein BH10PAT1_BH10PAT1_6290 [soil metagenome]